MPMTRQAGCSCGSMQMVAFDELLAANALTAHRDELVAILQTRDLPAVLKRLGVQPTGKRMALANMLRQTVEEAQESSNASPEIAISASDASPAISASDEIATSASDKIIGGASNDDEVGCARRQETCDELKQAGNDHLAANRIEEAIETYRRALTAGEPSSKTAAAVNSNLSLALLKTGLAEEAAIAADACIRIRPEWAKGYFRKGTALAKRGGPAAVSEAATCFNLAGARCVDERERREVGAVAPH